MDRRDQLKIHRRRKEQPPRHPVCPYSDCLEPVVGCGSVYTPDLWLEDGETYICPKCKKRSVQKNGGLIHA